MQIQQKIEKLRELMDQHGMQAYIVVTDDFHGSEYVGDYFKARAFMTGFTGSAGTLVVLKEEAALWTDGRYFLQAADQLEGSGILLMRMGEENVPKITEYLAEHLPENSVIGFDGRTISNGFAGQLSEAVADKHITFRFDQDLVDRIWTDRPALSRQPVWELDASYAGNTREEKLEMLKAKMAEHKADYLLIAALDEIAWLLNLRGGDVLCTPVFLAYMLLEDNKAVLYVQEEILSDSIREKLNKCKVDTAPYESVYDALSKLSPSKTVMLDGNSANYALVNSIPEGVIVVDEDSPVIAMKAVKTPAEMDHMRKAHIKDGVAVTRFIRWMQENVAKGGITELGAAAKLEEFRGQQEDYVEPSFTPIIAYGPHGAIVHYDPTEETDVELEPHGFCLADTGGHYLDGTTDITRTIALGELTEEEKKAYTSVLRGHLNLGAARFVHGVFDTNLDYLAREPLWEQGMDYNHGTGHGVGYLMNVHEGPQRFHWRVAASGKPTVLEEGMIISNEPGLYLEGKFGIRHENLVLVRKGEQTSYGQFMYLEPLTLVAFDREAILPELMTERELERLNDYHKKVYETIGPLLTEEEKRWLAGRTAPINK